MSSSSIVFQILDITQEYSFYTATIILIIGFIGNILNIIVFLNLKIFRNNQCAFYLTIESLVNTIQLILLFLIRILAKLNNGIDPANQSLLWCKLRTIIAQPVVVLSFFIVCFAAYDQFLSTSYQFNLRQISTYKLAKHLTLTACCICMIHVIPFGIFLEIKFSVCAVYNSAFNQYYQYVYYPILIGVLPISVSSLFSFLAFRSVRRLVRRQIPLVRRRLDRQLTAMILTRTVAFIVLVSPYVIHRIYWLQIDIAHEDPLRAAIDYLILAVIVSIFNINFAVE